MNVKPKLRSLTNTTISDFINTVSNEEDATNVDEQESDLYTGLVTNSCLLFSR
jgi:hypothetical protein